MWACGRLNDFLLLEDQLVSPKQYANGVGVALSKFKKCFASCKSGEQREKMMESLSDLALKELQQDNNLGGLGLSMGTAIDLDDLGVAVDLNSSKANMRLERAVKRELEKRLAAAVCN